MAETRKTYSININQATGRISTAAGSRVGVVVPELHLNNHFIFRCSVINADATAFEFPSDAVFFASLNQQLGQGSDDVAAAVDDDFNLPEQWDSISLPDGRISFAMHTSGGDLQTYLGTSETKRVWLEIWFKVPGGEFSIICQEQLVIRNTGSDFVPVDVDTVSYATSAELQAYGVLSVDDYASLPAAPADGTCRRIKAFNLVATYNATDGKWYNALGGEVGAEG